MYLIIIITSFLATWTSLALLNNSKFETEINSVLREMYLDQKSFLSNLKDLSILLLKESNERILSKSEPKTSISRSNKEEQHEESQENTNKIINIVVKPHVYSIGD